MENINWADQRTNLIFVRPSKRLLERLKRWLGHILREESLVKEVIKGRMEAETRIRSRFQ